MYSLLAILLLACVCSSTTVDARRTSRPPSESDIAQETLNRELYQCGYAVERTCLRPAFTELNSKRGILRGSFATQFRKRGIKEMCRWALQVESCAVDVWTTQCSAEVREYTMKLLRRQITAVLNIRQYVCIQHIESFGELVECINRTEQQDVYIDDVLYYRCQAFFQSLNFVPFCSVGDHLDCVTEVITTNCDQTAADALHGLIDGILSDIGCCISSEASGGNERVLELLSHTFN